MTALPSLHGWVPVLAQAEAASLHVELCRIGHLRFAEPGFEDTVAVAMRQPFHSAFRQRLDIETLARWVDRHPGLQPRGFVFHMSRCGATRLSQWLAAVPAHRVMAEPPPLDAVLRASSAADTTTRMRWLQTMVGLLGQTTRTDERRLFVKFDSWHAHHLPLVRRSFPQVPWVFLVRDPVEVLLSHQRQCGAQMVPGMLDLGLPGLDRATAACLPREDYAARVLGGICGAVEQVLSDAPRAGLVIDHAQLPATLGDRVTRHFGLQPDTAARPAMEEAAQPAANGTPPTHPHREASDAVREAAARWVDPVYRRLLARTMAA